jgi:Concanavalin A-like lectin/glucanases superfamily/Immunoglobulin domain
MKSSGLLLALVSLTSVVFGPNSSPAAIQVLEWKFENNLTDTSGHGNDGTPTGSPAYVEGKFGQGISLAQADAIQNVAATGLPMAGNASWSINLWMNLPAEPASLVYVAGFGPVGSTGAGTARGLLAFGGTGANDIYCWGNSRDLDAGQRYPTNTWTMITLTHNGTDNTTIFYVDGAEISRGTQVLSDIPAAENKISLAPLSFWGNDVEGTFDEFSVWDGVLSDSEVFQLLGLAGITINSQPQPVNRYACESAQMTVQAVGDPPPTYQWSHDGTPVDGATNATIVFTNLSAADAGDYTVTVSNAGGSVVSEPATLTVTPVPDVATALAGYWNFDEGTGDLLVDYSGNGNDGALLNFPTDDSQWVAGQIGGGLNFRGPTGMDYVLVANYPKPTATMTISAWVWADARPQWASITKNWAGSPGQFHFGLYDTAGDLSNFITQQGGATPSARENTALPLGSWQHVAFVCDGARLRLYRNGVEVSSSAYNGTLTSTPINDAMGIGVKLNNDATAPQTGSEGFWQGKMDDLGLWTRGLCPDEILAIYSAGIQGHPLNEAVVGAVAPAISDQPSNIDAVEGTDATFRVTAAGTPPLRYQWYKNGSLLEGETNSNLTLPAVCAGDAGDYTVTICNVAGCADSAPPAPLTVSPLPLDPITGGLVGHWTFDETSGLEAADSSGSDIHGELENYAGDGSQWVPGQIGGALSFGGLASQNWVLVSDYPKPTSTMTISAWVWANSRPNWASIAKNWGAASAGQFHFGLRDVAGDLSNFIGQQPGGAPSARENVLFPLDSWQHVAFVCDGSRMRLYRNGAEVASATYDGTINATPLMTTLAIGCKTDDTGLVPDIGVPGFWDGLMDDMGLWLRGLSGIEIQAIYQAGLDGRDLTQADVLPRLKVQLAGNDAFISWPSVPAGKCFELEWSDVLPATSWTPAGVAVSTDGRYQVTVDATAGTRFYRLRKL